MYKLIIVDDEEEIRSGLAEVVNWNDIGFEVAGLFEDGADAIAYLNNCPVDVVLTDIRMAEVSGLAVAQFIYTMMPDTMVVINSGYQDFEYAQQAIRFNVTQYLLKPTKISEVREVFSAIRNRLDERKEHSKIKTEHQQYKELFPDLTLKDTTTTELDSSTNGLVEQAKSYIDENFAQDISLELVAEKIYVHPAYLSRLFKQVTGKTFSDYVSEVRMKRATELLRSEQYKIHEISERVGYNSIKYFTKVFKKYAGCTPERIWTKMDTVGSEIIEQKQKMVVLHS